MKQDLFANLPFEIIINILSTLPLYTIICCKCVCKSWLTLLETPQFVRFHLLKAIPGLTLCSTRFQLKYFDLEDGRDLVHRKLHHNLVHPFNLHYKNDWDRICGSVNGLIFIIRVHRLTFCICNPITRDYVEFDCPEEGVYGYCKEDVTYGFGASRITGQHKAVVIFKKSNMPGGVRKPNESVCHVYTLETGLWSMTPSLVVNHDGSGHQVFLNGNLHWLVLDNTEDPWLQISCFDLEEELFSLFSSPLLRGDVASVGLSVLGDCLCLCDVKPNGFDLWIMKEYGVEKSWTTQFYICDDYHNHIYFGMSPIKVLKDGDMMLLKGSDLYYYSKKKENMIMLQLSRDGYSPLLHAPSFLSLKSFGMKNVRSF